MAAIQPRDLGIGRLFERVPDAVVVADPANGLIVLWNPAAERLFGYGAAEACQMSVEVLIPESMRAAHRAGLARFNVSGHGAIIDAQLPLELVALHRDGTAITIELTLSPIESGQERRRYVLAIIRDLTERKRAEEAHASELALRESHRRIYQFLGVASHELRTPLGTIRGNVQLARRRLGRVIESFKAGASDLEGPLTTIQEVLRRADLATDRLNALIEDLLDITRIESQRIQLHPEPCDLIALVREVVAEQRLLTPDRVIDLDVSAGEPACVQVDTGRIHQVLTNYVTNALKFAPPDRPITAGLRVEAPIVRVWVSDEGPGIPAEEQERIWDRFYQIEDTQGSAHANPGLGLGLFISRTLVEAHGGQAGVTSAPGQGATFWFTLPLARLDPVAQ